MHKNITKEEKTPFPLFEHNSSYMSNSKAQKHDKKENNGNCSALLHKVGQSFILMSNNKEDNNAG